MVIKLLTGIEQLPKITLSIYQQGARANLSISYNYSFKDPFHQFNFFCLYVPKRFEAIFSGFLIAIIHLIPNGDGIALLRHLVLQILSRSNSHVEP